MSNFSFLLASSLDSWLPILLIVGMFVLLYFFMIRPQKKREKEDAAMRDAVQVGDEVTTIGGIIGKVISVKGETFVLETTKDKTKIRFLKGAIRSVDVRAADLAAAILETKEADTAEAEADEAVDFMTESLPAEEATTEEAPLSKRAARKQRRQEAAQAAVAAMGNGAKAPEAEAVEEAVAEEAPVTEEAPATEENA